MNFFYDFFNLFFKWLRINRDLQENLGETPRCRRGVGMGGVGGPRTPEGGLTGKGGVVRVGMGWERWELRGLEKERVVMGLGGWGN